MISMRLFAIYILSCVLDSRLALFDDTFFHHHRIVVGEMFSSVYILVLVIVRRTVSYYSIAGYTYKISVDSIV